MNHRKNNPVASRFRSLPKVNNLHWHGLVVKAAVQEPSLLTSTDYHNTSVFTPHLFASAFPFRCGRVGKQSRQGSVSTNIQGSVQRSAILQILNCLYNPHPSPHGCFNPSNGFFYGRSQLFKTQPQNNTNKTMITTHLLR